MYLIFRGDPAELQRGVGLSRQSITLEGVTFVMNEPRDASGLSPKLQAKLRVNSHFDVLDAGSAESAPAACDETEEISEPTVRKRMRKGAEE